MSIVNCTAFVILFYKYDKETVQVNVTINILLLFIYFIGINIEICYRNLQFIKIDSGITILLSFYSKNY